MLLQTLSVPSAELLADLELAIVADGGQGARTAPGIHSHLLNLRWTKFRVWTPFRASAGGLWKRQDRTNLSRQPASVFAI